jgi:hypothetical protein
LRTFVAGQEARTLHEFMELALGTPLELWLGVEGETAEECAAREDAARDILADDPELFDRVSQVAAVAIETIAPDLLNVARMLQPRVRRRQGRKAAA